MTADWKDHIASKITICHGKVCIKDTRVMISVILDCVAEGMTWDEILVDYPSLTNDDIKLTLSYVAILARNESIY